ncbi:hypothetical protein [Candidatus Planktophila versatilis]|uniref:hypothetical protein n=1 Tax=Candidatus Planktophila versatilis TaxID=1884905 RepID=UPI003BEF2005
MSTSFCFVPTCSFHLPISLSSFCCHIPGKVFFSVIIPSMLANQDEILIVGICRDVGEEIANDIRRLKESFSDFKKVYFYIIESDSKDNTVAILTDLSKEFSNFDFVSLGKVQPQIPDRWSRIAYLRNLCIAEFLKSEKYVHCNFVVVSDLDGVNRELTPSSVKAVFERSDWAACFANQSGHYYDIFALRHPTWSPDDCWKHEKVLRSRGVNPIRARELAVYKRQIKIRPNSNWIEVDSAFGGLGIYKREFLTNALYESRDSNDELVCEHVSFNKGVSRNGGRLFVVPAFINFKLNGHNHPMLKRKRAKRFVKLALWYLFPPSRKLFASQYL